jgi:uncharacterized protein
MSTLASEAPGKSAHSGEQGASNAPEAGANRQERSLFLADPGPLGLTALSLPLAALSWINIGMAKPTAITVVLATLLAYGALGQLAVAMWEVLRGNVFGVVAFGTFGCFNLALWYFFSYQLPKIPAGQRPADLALFLGIWAIPAFILWVASFRTNLVINLIFMLATALFVVAAWGNYDGDSAMVKAGGWIGIALAAVAWYGCASGLLKTTFGRVILPVPELKGRQRSEGHRIRRHLAPVTK